MNDDEMLATMRSSLTGVTESMTDVNLDRPVSTIQARARGRRVRRGLAGASAGGLALGIGLALAAGVGSPAGGGSPGPGARPVHVNLDAWSVNTLSSGLVYVDVRELQNPALLRRTLAEAGVPAIVTFGEFCIGPNGGGTENLVRVIGKTGADSEARLTIDPAEIPHGSELSIGIVTASKNGAEGLESSFGVVNSGAKLTCSHPSAGIGAVNKGTGNPAGSGTAKPGLGG